MQIRSVTPAWFDAHQFVQPNPNERRWISCPVPKEVMAALEDFFERASSKPAPLFTALKQVLDQYQSDLQTELENRLADVAEIQVRVSATYVAYLLLTAYNLALDRLEMLRWERLLLRRWQRQDKTIWLEITVTAMPRHVYFDGKKYEWAQASTGIFLSAPPQWESIDNPVSPLTEAEQVVIHRLKVGGSTRLYRLSLRDFALRRIVYELRHLIESGGAQQVDDFRAAKGGADQPPR